MTLANGAKLGPYEVLEPIGAGGMGEVYRARDSRLGRDVAIKVLPESFARDADRLRRFELEARAVAALNHASILAVYDIGEFNGSPYLVCELLEGETLREKMSEGALPQRRAVDYATQIAEGLDAAHDKGIVHRDLKPENVFVTRDGKAKILDFGLAKLARAESAAASMADTRGPTVTTPGVALGTAGYMSPEQVRGKEVDARTDIFAFGAILYEMLSGQRAFRGDTSVETMNAILKEEPPELETEKLRVSPGLERLVRRCLEKERERRFQSARDLEFALEAISGTSASTQTRAIPQPALKARAAQIALAAATLLAVATLAFFAGSRTVRPQDTVENQFQLLTFRPQTIFRAAFAPDGKTIIFSSAQAAARPDIFMLSPEYPEPRATDLKNTQLLSVSSKGELAVLTDPKLIGHRIFRGTLARLPIGGSAPRAMLDEVMEADWAPDGSDLAITRIVDGKCRLEFPAGKVLAQTNGYFSDLRFSPKGDKIAYFEHALRFDDRGSLAIVDLAGKSTTLTPTYWGEEGLAWSPDGREILFGAGTGSYSSFPIRGVTLDGKLRIVQDSAGGLWLHDINREGKWLATQEQAWREMSGAGPGAKSEIDLSFLDFSSPQAISSDGKVLLFSEENGFFGSNYSVCIRKMDGSPTVSIGEGVAADLTQDGSLALAIVLTSPDKLMLYPTGAGAPRQLNTGSVRNLENAQFFSDKKRVLFCGSEPGHGTRCYVTDLAGGTPKAVTPEGTTEGIPTPDGTEVLALDTNGDRSQYPVNGGPPRLAKGLAKDERGWFRNVLGWTSDGKDLIVRALESDVSVLIQRVDLQSGKRTTLRRLAVANPVGFLGLQNIAVSNDAQYYAYAVRRQHSSLYLVNRSK